RATRRGIGHVLSSWRSMFAGTEPRRKLRQRPWAWGKMLAGALDGGGYARNTRSDRDGRGQGPGQSPQVLRGNARAPPCPRRGWRGRGVQTGQTRLLVYKSQFAGTNQATAATWSVGDVDGTVKDLKARGVRFERYDFPDAKHEGDVHVMGHTRAAWF